MDQVATGDVAGIDAQFAALTRRHVDPSTQPFGSPGRSSATARTRRTLPRMRSPRPGASAAACATRPALVPGSTGSSSTWPRTASPASAWASSTGRGRGRHCRRARDRRRQPRCRAAGRPWSGACRAGRRPPDRRAALLGRPDRRRDRSPPRGPSLTSQAVTTTGALVESWDGGRTWSEIATPPAARISITWRDAWHGLLVSNDCADTNSCAVAAGSAWLTVDGGRTWHQVLF